MLRETPFELALYLAEHGFSLFPSGPVWGHGAEKLATSDADVIARIHRIDSSCNWRVRCGAEFGLVVLDTPRLRDTDILLRELGSMPSTLTIARSSAGHHRWFRVNASYDVKCGEALFATRAVFKLSAPLPGNFNHRQNEQYVVMGGGAFDLSQIAHLPTAWLAMLPTHNMTTTRRYEYRPPNGNLI